ncbi:MAG: helix-turn-helix transcriptional regulator [Butyricicoccus sp.]
MPERICFAMFKRRTGFSLPIVINSRIERAKVLLVRTQKPIAEIAEEVGYSTSGSLINLFVKKVGTSPRQYRIQHMSKAIDAVCKTDVPFIDTDVPEL